MRIPKLSPKLDCTTGSEQLAACLACCQCYMTGMRTFDAVCLQLDFLARAQTSELNVGLNKGRPMGQDGLLVSPKATFCLRGHGRAIGQPLQVAGTHCRGSQAVRGTPRLLVVLLLRESVPHAVSMLRLVCQVQARQTVP